MKSDIAINTRTQQEWDQVSSILGIEWMSAKWTVFREDSVIYPGLGKWSSLGHAIKRGYAIYLAEDWLKEKATAETIDKQSKITHMTTPHRDPVISWISRKTGVTYGWTQAIVYSSIAAIGIAAIEYVMMHK